MGAVHSACPRIPAPRVYCCQAPHAVHAHRQYLGLLGEQNNSASRPHRRGRSRVPRAAAFKARGPSCPRCQRVPALCCVRHLARVTRPRHALGVRRRWHRPRGRNQRGVRAAEPPPSDPHCCADVVAARVVECCAMGEPLRRCAQFPCSAFGRLGRAAPTAQELGARVASRRQARGARADDTSAKARRTLRRQHQLWARARAQRAQQRSDTELAASLERPRVVRHCLRRGRLCARRQHGRHGAACAAVCCRRCGRRGRELCSSGDDVRSGGARAACARGTSLGSPCGPTLGLDELRLARRNVVAAVHLSGVGLPQRAHRRVCAAATPSSLLCCARDACVQPRVRAHGRGRVLGSLLDRVQPDVERRALGRGVRRARCVGHASPRAARQRSHRHHLRELRRARGQENPGVPQTSQLCRRAQAGSGRVSLRDLAGTAGESAADMRRAGGALARAQDRRPARTLQTRGRDGQVLGRARHGPRRLGGDGLHVG
eukprot:Amastigsp_a845057_11.p2 type:complete len:489 gc:universal Amastigsp_a845057_11:736-2202(+)